MMLSSRIEKQRNCFLEVASLMNSKPNNEVPGLALTVGTVMSLVKSKMQRFSGRVFLLTGKQSTNSNKFG